MELRSWISWLSLNSQENRKPVATPCFLCLWICVKQSLLSQCLWQANWQKAQWCPCNSSVFWISCFSCHTATVPFLGIAAPVAARTGAIMSWTVKWRSWNKHCRNLNLRNDISETSACHQVERGERYIKFCWLSTQCRLCQVPISFGTSLQSNSFYKLVGAQPIYMLKPFHTLVRALS
jgi:hypothetical protein